MSLPASPTDPAGRADARVWAALDLLASLVAVVDETGQCLFVNAALEDAVGASRKALARTRLHDWLDDPRPLREALSAVARNQFSTARFDGVLRGQVGLAMPRRQVHVILCACDQPDDGVPRLLVEMVEIQQQARQDREERVMDQAQATKELVRNLAHEIKNPLGGIRGSAQLLALELESRADLAEYTDVIVKEADRLQLLVDRLLAPHRRPHVVGDVNIHEVTERVRRLVLAEFPSGLAIERDYDTSLPVFRGDVEQLIQAVLNIVRNAAQALADRRAEGDAVIRLQTRVGRQITIGKQRYRLALELLVEDNGPGIPEHIRDRIFFPLVSGREGGSGLGLPLAQTFVQQHQGTIECASEPGRTQFKIVLPLP